MSQDYKNKEIIIIEDGSTDGSMKIIKKYLKNNKDHNIGLYEHIKNKGISYSRNEAIKMSKGEYFLFLDSDDKIPKNYVTSFYNQLIRHLCFYILLLFFCALVFLCPL